MLENGSKANSPPVQTHQNAEPNPTKQNGNSHAVKIPDVDYDSDNYNYMKNPENKMSVSVSPIKKSSEAHINVDNIQNYQNFMTSYDKSEDCYKITNSILLNSTLGGILFDQCSKK